MFSKTRVAVLRGGPSAEYYVSLRTGATVLAEMPEAYHPLDIFIDQQGEWHAHGKRVEPHKILNRVDVVWNALHGAYGEDGELQHLLETHAIPFVGSNRLASALTFNKSLAKGVVQSAGIQTPYFAVFRKDETPSIKQAAVKLYRSFPQPSVIKPNNSGSSIGVAVAHTHDEIIAALTAVFSMSDTALVEEYLQGREAVCGIIEGFRGAAQYALLPAEVVLQGGARHLDFKTRYGAAAPHRCPGKFTPDEKEELQRLAVEVHTTLGLRHYSRSEFIVHPKRGIFFIESDTVPDFHQGSPFLQSLEAVGAGTAHLIEHLLSLALKKKETR